MERTYALPFLLSGAGFSTYLGCAINHTQNSGDECSFQIRFNPAEDKFSYSDEIVIGDKEGVDEGTGLVKFIREEIGRDVKSLSTDEILSFGEMFDSSRYRISIGNFIPGVSKMIGGSDSYRPVLDFHTHPYQTHGVELPFFSIEDLKHYLDQRFPFGAVLSTRSDVSAPCRGFLIGITRDCGEDNLETVCRQIARFEYDLRNSESDGFGGLNSGELLDTRLGAVVPIFYNQGVVFFNSESMEQVGKKVLEKNHRLLQPFRKK